MPGPALEEPTLAAPFVHGTKRKASSLEDIELFQNASRMCPPIKLEPGSPDENASTISMGLSEAQLAYKGRLDTSFGDNPVSIRQEVEVDAARVPLHETEKENDALLRSPLVLENLPPQRRLKSSQRPKATPRPSGNTLGDVAYDSIPDYAPPTSTLPAGNPHILQVHWPQEAVIDLSNDPDRCMLHEAEIGLATSLNLSCAKYLCTKRRIFQARFQALQDGREFKKSQSQKACKINTNKANKICNVFEKVGWFDEKYFLQHLEDSSNKLRKSNKGTEDRRSSSSELSEPDIWDVSESEFHFTTEGDDESSDEDTADSSVLSDGKHDMTRGRKSLESYSDPSRRKQPYELSPTGEDEDQGTVRNEKEVQTVNTLSKDATCDEGSIIQDRRPERGFVLEKTPCISKPASPSGVDTEDFPLLETRSMTQRLKLARNSLSQDKSIGPATIEARESHPKSTLEISHRHPVPTNQFALRYPIPKSLEEASAADVMLVKMKEKSRPWLEIEEAWEKETGKAQPKKSLYRRYARIMENFANTRLRADEKADKDCSLTYSPLEPADDQLLLAAEAEIEQNYQREKADILAEIESSFQSEKWDRVAEAMSRAGPTTYSAESVLARYERLTNESKGAAAKTKSSHETFTDLPRQTSRVVRGDKSELSTLSRSVAGRLDTASNATNASADGEERGHQKLPKYGPHNHAEHSARMRKVWAKRRALGTNGRDGGPPKASTAAKQAKITLPITKTNAGASLASTIIRPSGHAQEYLSNQKRPIIGEDQVGRDANQHKHSLALIVPPAALVKDQ